MQPTRIQQIAEALAKGSVDAAAALRFNEGSPDGSMDVEVLEVARQSMIAHLKSGNLSVACAIRESFDMPDDLSEEVIKHAVMSCYRDGNLARILEIRKKVPMSKELLEGIIGYCESWGEREEAKAMRSVFLGQAV